MTLDNDRLPGTRPAGSGQPYLENPEPSDRNPENPASHSGASHGDHEHVAHHVAEFGHVENLIHINSPPRLSEEDALPAPPVTRRDKLAKQHRMSRLRRRCFHERHLHQYWHNETLYRTAANRSITPDELFLDLVIVGGIATLGHELRISFHEYGWQKIEPFFLLFGALYSSWRNLVILWNIWGICSDFIDKLGIYVVFTSLIFIALGAADPFDPKTLPYVAAASFIATATPCLSSIAFALQEPLLKDGGGRTIYSQSIFFIISASPYFAAIFVRSNIAARILFWIAFALNSVFAISLSFHTRYLVEKFQKDGVLVTQVAIAIELMVEKYDVLTMIVLGESVLSILFEGAHFLIEEDVHRGSLFGAVAASTALLYSLQTLYNNVDSPIPRGGKHALRFRKLYGLSWSQLHIPYHASLILLATGLGLALRDIALPPKTDTASEAAYVVLNAIRAGGDSEGIKTEPEFDYKEKWLLAVGWGASVILSGLIGAFHFPGPRAATKRWRFSVRCVIALAIMVGMPFSDLAAGYYLGVFCAVSVFIAVFEYLFVQMDKMGFFRSEATTFSSSTDEVAKEISFDDIDQEDSSDDLGDAQGLNLDINRGLEGGGAEAAQQDAIQVDDILQSGQPTVIDALRNRLGKKHVCRLVRASDRKCSLERNVGTVV